MTQIYSSAIPSQIKQVMNVPNLTREQVASHLQKYRKLFPFLRTSREEIKLNVCEPACLEEVISLANNSGHHHQTPGIQVSVPPETNMRFEGSLDSANSTEPFHREERKLERKNGKFQMKSLDGIASVFSEHFTAFTATETIPHGTLDPESPSDTSLDLKSSVSTKDSKSCLSEAVEKELFSAVTHKSFYTNRYVVRHSRS